MRRVLAYILPILVLAGFIWVMNTDALLKGSKSEGDDFSTHLAILQDALLAEDWDMAVNSLAKANQAWNDLIPRIQYGAEKDQVSNLSISLNRIKGSILAKDRAGALSELGASSQLWSRIGK